MISLETIEIGARSTMNFGIIWAFQWLSALEIFSASDSSDSIDYPSPKMRRCVPIGAGVELHSNRRHDHLSIYNLVIVPRRGSSEQ